VVLNGYLRVNQGENTIRFTLILFIQAYRLSIHFMASTSLILPKYLSVVDKFEWRNMIFEMISIGTPERLA